MTPLLLHTRQQIGLLKLLSDAITCAVKQPCTTDQTVVNISFHLQTNTALTFNDFERPQSLHAKDDIWNCVSGVGLYTRNADLSSTHCQDHRQAILFFKHLRDSLLNCPRERAKDLHGSPFTTSSNDHSTQLKFIEIR